MTHIAIIMGSINDEPAIKGSGMLKFIDSVGVSREIHALSAHRHLREVLEICESMEKRSEKRPSAILAVMGMLPGLPGAVSGAVKGRIPVLGVQLSTSTIPAITMIPAMASMPTGRPVAVMGGDKAGLMNAAILAAAIATQGSDQAKFFQAMDAEDKERPHEHNVVFD